VSKSQRNTVIAIHLHYYLSLTALNNNGLVLLYMRKFSVLSPSLCLGILDLPLNIIHPLTCIILIAAYPETSVSIVTVLTLGNDLLTDRHYWL